MKLLIENWRKLLNEDVVEFPSEATASERYKNYLMHMDSAIKQIKSLEEIFNRQGKTTEELVILEGQMKVEIYDNKLDFITNVVLEKGDTITLIDGGHGITLNKDTKFVEVKQGPYQENIDKKRF